jgi:uncharacterized integral membrane protein
VSLFSVSSPSTHAQLGIAAETPPLAEPRRQQLIRHRHRLRLYTWTVLFIAALVVLAVLIAANARSVKLDWVFGSTHASLVWTTLATTVLGWLLGLATSVLFRFRTRREVTR